MNDDKTVRVASGIAVVAIIALGSLSLRVEANKNDGYRSRYEPFQETSTDHGYAQVKREFAKIYPAFRKFIYEQSRFPAGSPSSPRSELRRFLGLTADDLRPPIEWAIYTSMDPGYSTKYMERRCDGTQKPIYPRKGERDVWFSCEVGGDKPSVVLLWSDGKIETRSADERLAVRLRTPRGQTGMFGMTMAFGDETGVPLVYRTTAQRNQSLAYMPTSRPSRMPWPTDRAAITTR